MRAPSGLQAEVARCCRTRAAACAHERGDVGQRRAGVEDPRHAGVQQHLLVLVGHDAADDDGHVAQAGLAQRHHQLGHDEVVGGQRRDADHVHVLFGGQLHHGGDLLPGRRVDHLHAGVAQAAATMRLPRSWPSKPILVTSTLGMKFVVHALSWSPGPGAARR
jgi:hypothetical protein